jgi:hypothetical protein
VQQEANQPGKTTKRSQETWQMGWRYHFSPQSQVRGEEVSAEVGGEEKQRRGTELHEIDYVTS